MKPNNIKPPNKRALHFIKVRIRDFGIYIPFSLLTEIDNSIGNQFNFYKTCVEEFKDKREEYIELMLEDLKI